MNHAQMNHAQATGHDHHDCCSGPKAKAMAKDPVCGMDVDPATTPHHAQHEGEDFHFCSARCREKFIAAPEGYLSGSPPAQEAPEGAIWTCPMHPEIQQVGPGTCPICGMALEPMEPSLDEGPNPELVDFTRRLKVAGALAIPLMFLSMGAEMLGLGLFSPGGRRSANLSYGLTFREGYQSSDGSVGHR